MIRNPIENKYREGKVKSTLKRESNQSLKGFSNKRTRVSSERIRKIQRLKLFLTERKRGRSYTRVCHSCFCKERVWLCILLFDLSANTELVIFPPIRLLIGGFLFFEKGIFFLSDQF